MYTPHSLALSNDGTLLYVADRENKRIIVYDTISHAGRVFGQFDSRIFSIALHKQNQLLYAINGSIDVNDRCYGFTLNNDGDIVEVWGPPDVC